MCETLKDAHDITELRLNGEIVELRERVAHLEALGREHSFLIRRLRLDRRRWWLRLFEW